MQLVQLVELRQVEHTILHDWQIKVEISAYVPAGQLELQL
jgi:hypothetical protein